jgi:hypothetical protein
MKLNLNVCTKLAALCNYFDRAELGTPEIDGDSIMVHQNRMFRTSAAKRLKIAAERSEASFNCKVASSSVLTADLTKKGNNVYNHIKKMLKVAQIELINPRATVHGIYTDPVEFEVTLVLLIRLHPGSEVIELKIR